MFFDGNHRSRRVVNLGQSQQHQRGSRQNGRSPRVPGVAGGRVSHNQNNSGVTAKNDVTSATLILEEAKRRREDRRIQQLQNRSSLSIQRHYRGYHTRTKTLLLLEEIIRELMEMTPTTTSTSLETNVSKQREQEVYQTQRIQKLTSLLNFRWKMRLKRVPFRCKKVEKQQFIHIDNETFEWLNIYADELLLSRSIIMKSPPTPYSTHYVVLVTLQCLKDQIKSKRDNHLRENATVQFHIAAEKTLTILRYVLGPDTRDESIGQATNEYYRAQQLLRWKRLGGGSHFLLLVDCYQSQDGNQGTWLKAELLKLIKQIVPDTPSGRAFQSVLTLTTMPLPNLETSSDNRFENGGVFDAYVMSLAPLITNQSFSVDARQSPMELDGDQEKLNAVGDEEVVLQQAIGRMVADSSTVFLYNALFLYKLQMKNSSTLTMMGKLRATCTMVLLVYQVIVPMKEFSIQSSTSLVSSSMDFNMLEQNTLLSILVGRVVRGDDIFVGNLMKVSNNKFNDLDNNGIDSDDEDEDDPDPSTINATVTANSILTTPPTPTDATFATKKHKGELGILAQKGGGLGSGNSSTRLASSHLTKNEIQTVSKLDRLYAKDVQDWTQKAFASLTTLQLREQQENLLASSSKSVFALVQSLACDLADPELIIQWGRFLLCNYEEVTDNQCQDIGALVELARNAYVTIIAVLLQLTTGLRSRQNYASPFLTKLAFAPQFIALLWKHVILPSQKLTDSKPTRDSSNTNGGGARMAQYLSPSTYLAAAVFSDILAHSLIATKDDQFLQQYTALANENVQRTNDRSNFMASDVIGYIGSMLFELYWSKPVQANDFRMILPTLSWDSQQHPADCNHPLTHAARARLLLSGTKLWNSLYERWNRLIGFHGRADSTNHAQSSTSSFTPSHVMCDETSWWFPTMTSVLGAGGGVDRNISRHRRSIGLQANRDVDSSDEMSVDTAESENGDTATEPMATNETEASAVDTEGDELAEAFSDPRMARILTSIPQSVPFDRRVKLFDSLLKVDKRKSQVENSSTMHHAMLAMMRGDTDFDSFNVREKVEIRRDKLYDDSMKQLNKLESSKLKRRIQVTFINQHGAHEAGIDGGGVFKEFIDDLIKDAFSIQPSSTEPDNKYNNTTEIKRSTANIRLFTATPLQTLKINSDLFHTRKDVEALLPHYEFLGRVLGKAVYESILVDPQFCLPFLNQLLGKTNSVEDLKNYDPEYYRNLYKLLQLSDTELKELGLTFELTFGSGSKTRTIELLPGGNQKSVTKENVIQYIYLVAHQRLNVETALPTRAFLRGFRDLIPASWVRLFSAYELQKLISGDDSVKGIDIEAFKKSMQYAAGYHPSQDVIQWFWEIVDEMTADQQHKLLKFMTSCSRQPLLGFASLEPAPCIQQIRIPDSVFDDSNEEIIFKRTPLPSSSTCMNLLKLPNYRWKELMRKKLLAAVEAGAGFELT